MPKAGLLMLASLCRLKLFDSCCRLCYISYKPLHIGKVMQPLNDRWSKEKISNQSPVVPTPGLEKMPTGIEGFDEITGGGLLRNRTTLLMGIPGSGKTVFALQMLVNGAHRWKEPGIFVAFEENSRQLVQNASSFGWDLPTLERDRLFFLDARMSPEVFQAGDFDLLGMLASLKAKAEEMGAKRIVFDSIDVLLTLLDDRLVERREIYRIHDWLAESNMTGILTARSKDTKPFIARRYN